MPKLAVEAADNVAKAWLYGELKERQGSLSGWPSRGLSGPRPTVRAGLGHAATDLAVEHATATARACGNASLRENLRKTLRIQTFFPGFKASRTGSCSHRASFSR